MFEAAEIYGQGCELKALLPFCESLGAIFNNIRSSKVAIPSRLGLSFGMPLLSLIRSC